MEQKRILIYGAGVIGSVLAGRLARIRHNVTILARGKRLSEIRERGVLIQRNNQVKPQKVPVTVIDKLEKSDTYDYIIVALRGEQVDDILPVLHENKTENIVFMVNNPLGYNKWMELVGSDRVIPAFPGAGGKIKDGIIYYDIVSRFIQPTTFGELAGIQTKRVTTLMHLVRSAGFPVAFSRNMDAWQKTHLAMVIPLAEGIYWAGGNNYTTARNKEAIRKMAVSLKENFDFIEQCGIGIEPGKLKLIRLLPVRLLTFVLKSVYKTRWAESVISNHALAARSEMKYLSDQFISLADSLNYDLKMLKEMRKQEAK